MKDGITMDYMEDSKMEVLNYLRKQKVDIAALDEAVIDEMAYRYYKNYYSYEMDHDFAVMDAVDWKFRVNGTLFPLETACHFWFCRHSIPV